MFGLENRAQTSLFLLCHIEQKKNKTNKPKKQKQKTKTCQNDHFDFAFSSFWCTKTFNWWLSSVLGINKITYAKQKMKCFIHFSIFTTLFSQHVFPIHLFVHGYRVAYKWHMEEVTVLTSKWLMKHETLANFNKYWYTWLYH